MDRCAAGFCCGGLSGVCLRFLQGGGRPVDARSCNVQLGCRFVQTVARRHVGAASHVDTQNAIG